MQFKIESLGLVPYQEAWHLQLAHAEAIAAGEAGNKLFLVEHPPVLTLGAAFHEENLLWPIAKYEAEGIEVIRTDRGGDVTYHGPGQLVAYPVFSLDDVGRDLHRWLRNLEEVAIRTVESYDLPARRFAPHTGVWVGDQKVCAIGIKIKRYVSLHGLALNCNVAMAPFASIIPCGIQGYGVGSLSGLLGRTVGVSEVEPRFIDAFHSVFPA